MHRSGEGVITPSPSLNRALAAMCRETWFQEYSEAEFREMTGRIAYTYLPVTTHGLRIDADMLESWFEDLTVDEYLAMACGTQAVVRTERGAAWE